MFEIQYHKLGRWLLWVMAFLLSGCDAALLDPKGAIGLEQRTLIFIAIGLMLIVVIPAILMTFIFAWKYRASNLLARYTPGWATSNKIEVIIWLVPCLIIIILGTISYTSAHKLDPRKPIESSASTMIIEVISLDWKWLFITRTSVLLA